VNDKTGILPTKYEIGSRTGAARRKREQKKLPGIDSEIQC